MKKIRIRLTKISKMLGVILTLAMITTIMGWRPIKDITSDNHGNISIQVNYKGIPPKDAKYGKQISTCHHIVQDESLILDSLKGIHNVMLYLINAKESVGKQDFVINNKGCVFVPHVGFATVGSRLVMKNEDDMMHNVHAYYVVGESKRTIVNTTLPSKGAEMVNTKAFINPGEVEFKCDAHPWMSAYVIVVDNPYYSITNSTGRGKILNVPAGEYKLVIHHERLGAITRTVKVTSGQTTALKIEMSEEK